MALRPSRQVVFLGAAIVALALSIGLAYRWRTPAGPGSEATRPVAPSAASKAGAPQASVPKVGLEALVAKRPEPAEGERNPFRFQPKAPPPPPGAGGKPGAGGTSGSEPAAPPAPVTPPSPPQPPPIPLKFIGIVEGKGGVGKIAVLSDVRGVYQGREGEIIEGRYRIVRIGVESVEIEYVDGQGRQTIRLTGS